MSHIGKNRRKIFVGNLYTKWEHNPGTVADGGAKKENDRYRQEIDEKYGTSEQSILELVFKLHIEVEAAVY